jgi:hypothetical protein
VNVKELGCTIKKRTHDTNKPDRCLNPDRIIFDKRARAAINDDPSIGRSIDPISVNVAISAAKTDSVRPLLYGEANLVGLQEADEAMRASKLSPPHGPVRK